MTPDTVLRAPWSPDQFANIIRWQAAGWVHPLTCQESSHGPLALFGGALACIRCGYTQTWVPRLIAEAGPPPDPTDELFKVNLNTPYESEMTDAAPAELPPPTPPEGETFYVWTLVHQKPTHPIEETERMCVPEGWVYRVTHNNPTGGATVALIFVPSDFKNYVPVPATHHA